MSERPTVTEVPPETARRDPAALPIVDPACYEILGEHGRGGLGRILAARDKRTGRQVAIKEMLPGVAYAMARFAREARITANLQHPAIVPVYEVGRWPSGEPFYAMKLVIGRSLSDLLDEARDLKQRLALLPAMQTVADAIAYAHEQRIVHRDLKPSNVLLGKFGETVVIDWGLAKRIDDTDADAEPDEVEAAPLADVPGVDRQLTAIGAVMGTPAYMPPEQANGEAVDESSDIYALGVMLYEILSGKTPHREDGTPAELLSRIVAGEARPLRQLAPEIPAELVTIVEKASAYRRADRYAAAAELAADLRRFQTGQLVSAHRYSTWTLLRRWARRHRAVVAVSAIALCVLAIGGAIGVTGVVRERDRARRAEGVAVDNATRAARRLADLHEEEGRQLLVAGDPGRALVHFAAALRVTTPTPRLRFLTARALEPFAPLVRDLNTHTDIVTDAAFSPDGRFLATASRDRTVRVWDVAHGTEVATIAHDLKFPELAWSPDGARLAVIGGTSALIFDVATGKRTGEVALPMPSQVTAAAWGDGILVTGDYEGRVAVWDATTLALRARAADPEGTDAERITIRDGGRAIVIEGNQGVTTRDTKLAIVSTIAPGAPTIASPDGRFLLADGEPPTLLRVADGQVIGTLDGAGGLHAAAFSEDGARVVATGEGTTRIWDAATGAPGPVLLGHTGKVSCTAWRADGAVLATGGEDRTVRLWDAATGAPLATFSQGSKVSALRFSPDGAFLAATDDDYRVTLWDTRARGAAIGLGGPRERVPSAAMDGTGTLAVIAGGDGRVALYDAHTGALRGELAAAGTPHVAGLATNGRLLIAGPDGTRVVDAEGRLVATIAGSFADAQISTDGARVVTLDGPGTRVAVWRADDGAAVDHRDLDAAATALAISPDGARVAFASTTVEIWEVASYDRGAPVTSPKPADRLAFSPDGTRLAVSGGDEALVLDARGAAPAITLASEGVMALAWTADGSRLATGGFDQVVHVWNTTTGEQVARLTGHGGAISSLTWSDDGMLLSGDVEGTVRAWDADRGRLLTTWAPGGRVFHLVLRDGRLLVAGSGAAPQVIDASGFVGDPARVDLAVRCWSHAALRDESIVPATSDAAACDQLRNVSSDKP